MDEPQPIPAPTGVPDGAAPRCPEELQRVASLAPSHPPRHRRDALANQINALLEALLWLAGLLDNRDAPPLTRTELARLFDLHGYNWVTLAERLSRAKVLTPKTQAHIAEAYHRSRAELLHHRGAPE